MRLKEQNILIIVPAQFKGGVYNFYENISQKLPSNYQYYYLKNDNVISKIKGLQTIYDFTRVFRLIKKKSIGKLILNPSLKKNAVIRDSIFALMGYVLNVKVVVFWRGFDFDNLILLQNPYRYLTFLLLKADKSVVLYSKIAESLRDLGYKGEIKTMTVLVNDEVFKYRKDEPLGESVNLIFLSRVEEYKGIYELLDAYTVLSAKYKNLKLTIAGFGDELPNVIDFVKNRQPCEISVKGYLSGEDKYRELSKADIFILPSYSEGMPNAVLEAMAFGLPVVTTRVGGLNDFFEEGKMGYFIDMKSVESIVLKIETLLCDKGALKEISKFNKDFALIHFTSAKVVKEFVSI